MKVFIVTMYQPNSIQDAQYIEGVYDNVQAAITNSLAEEEWQKGRYKADIRSIDLNETTSRNRGKYEAR